MIQIFYTLFSRSYPVLFICNFYQSTPSYTHRNKNKPILKSSSQENKNIKNENNKNYHNLSFVDHDIFHVNIINCKYIQQLFR